MADSWMETRSGKQFSFENPTADMIDVFDIAAALSKQCRYNGHCEQFYSVAQHSIHIAEWIKEQGFYPEVALQGLLHDATEAYIGDMVSPLKRLIPAFSEYEDQLWCLIADKFGVPREMHPLVKEADARIIVDEKDVLMTNTRHPWGIDNIDGLGIRQVLRYRLGRKHINDAGHFIAMFEDLVMDMETVREMG